MPAAAPALTGTHPVNDQVDLGNEAAVWFECLLDHAPADTRRLPTTIASCDQAGVLAEVRAAQDP
jgi:hypothetical protein